MAHILARVDDLVAVALRGLPAKPADTALQAAKKRYSEQLSNAVAQAVAAELRHRGLKTALPAPPGEVDRSGAERRMAGGIGAKKVDVTWTTEESGLLLGISIKSINFRDSRSGHFQKNLTNRRGDMLIEAVTLHRRFPYAVLGGLFFLDSGAEADGTKNRKSTFLNAHSRMRLFTGRNDPAGRDEQYEGMFLILFDVNSSSAMTRAYEVGDASREVSMSEIIDSMISLVAERNPDFYECIDGNLVEVR